MFLELVSNMQWPFAMVCIAFFGSCTAVYITRRAVDASETANENRRLSSEVYRLTQITSEK